MKLTGSHVRDAALTGTADSGPAVSVYRAREEAGQQSTVHGWTRVRILEMLGTDICLPCRGGPAHG